MKSFRWSISLLGFLGFKLTSKPFKDSFKNIFFTVVSIDCFYASKPNRHGLNKTNINSSANSKIYHGLNFIIINTLHDNHIKFDRTHSCRYRRINSSYNCCQVTVPRNFFKALWDKRVN